jgi:hypothetical protein
MPTFTAIVTSEFENKSITKRIRGILEYTAFVLNNKLHPLLFSVISMVIRHEPTYTSFKMLYLIRTIISLIQEAEINM